MWHWNLWVSSVIEMSDIQEQLHEWLTSTSLSERCESSWMAASPRRLGSCLECHKERYYVWSATRNGTMSGVPQGTVLCLECHKDRYYVWSATRNGTMSGVPQGTVLCLGVPQGTVLCLECHKERYYVWSATRNSTMSGVPQGTVLCLECHKERYYVWSATRHYVRWCSSPTSMTSHTGLTGRLNCSWMMHFCTTQFGWSRMVRLCSMTYTHHVVEVTENGVQWKEVPCDVTRNSNITSCSYKLGEDKLTAVSHHPYLGVELDDHLNWKEQTERAEFSTWFVVISRMEPHLRSYVKSTRVWYNHPWDMAAYCGARNNGPESRHSKPSKIKVQDTLTKTGTDTRVWQPWRKTLVGSRSRKDAWLTDCHL